MESPTCRHGRTGKCNACYTLEWQRRNPERVRAKQNAYYHAHYARPRPTPEERFWSKVVKGEGCWTWMASTTVYGYGQIRFQGTMHRAHRVAFFLTHGRWPEPMALHGCDNALCVRPHPEHVHEGTQTDNMREAAARSRIRNQHGTFGKSSRPR